MSVVAIVGRQPRFDSFFKCRSAGEVAALEEASTQDAEEQFHLVEPRTVDRCEVERVFVSGIAQEYPAFPTGLECFGDEGNPAAFGDPLADLQAPMRVEIVDHPVEAFQERELGGDMVEVPDPIDAGARRPQVPNDLTGGDAERCQQGAGAVANVLELALFDVTGAGGPRRVFALEDLHPGLLVAGKDQTALLVKAWGVEVQLANGFGLGVEVGIVTVEPVDAAMGFEIGLRQDAFDGAAAHVAVMGIAEDLEGEVVETPGGVGLLMVFGLATGECNDVESLGGGKISAVDRSVERLGGRSGRGQHSVLATDPRCGGRS